MSPDPDERLLELALEVTDAAPVDWDVVRATWPGEPRAVEALETLSRLAAIGEPEPGEDEAAFGVEAGPANAAATAGGWGPLELRQWIGEGSFGEVYVAWDLKLEREVALKLHRREAAGRSERWLEEARRLARVRHPNVVAIHGADLHDGRAGMWMELVRGRTLETRLQREGPLGAREAALVGIDLCGALAAVHAAGLAHGDVKTGNVVREGVSGETRDAGRIVLMDFGSAHDSGDLVKGAPGTPRFTAPEVLAGGRPSEAADVWSLGVVLYRLVTNGWPWPAKDLAALRERIAAGPAVALRSVRPDLPGAYVSAVERALEREPERRWKHTADLERALLAVLAHERTGSAERMLDHGRARRARTRVLAVGAALALLATVGTLVAWKGRALWMAWRSRQPVLASAPLREWSATEVSEGLGGYILDLRDFDGDGQGEVLIASPGAAGSGRVVIASVAGDGTIHPKRTLQAADVGESFGMPSVGPADFNGDGQPDIAIASPYHDGVGRDAGRIYVYFGGAGMDDSVDVVIPGPRAGQYFGFGIGAGDVNGDDVADLLVGAPLDRGAGVATGRAYVYFGGRDMDAVPDLELATASEGSQFGVSATALPDLNADGHGDFFIGANYDHTRGRFRGRAFVYWGGPRLDARPDLVLDGDRDGEHFGVGRAPAGDVNGDGVADLVISRERGNGLQRASGAVSIYFGGPAPKRRPDLVLPGERTGDGFGFAVDAKNDVDGDGAVDLVIGAPWYDGAGGGAAGRLYVYLGGRRLDDVPDLVLDGPSTAAQLGWAVAVIGDLRDDGFAALVIGAPGDSRSLTNAGSVHVHDLGRWAVPASADRTTWTAGATGMLVWNGAVPASVSLSTDEGKTWRVVAKRAGGRPSNRLTVPVPADARDHVRVRFESLRRDAPAVLERRIVIASR